jgi:hypothetical protein
MNCKANYLPVTPGETAPKLRTATIKNFIAPGDELKFKSILFDVAT